MLKVAIVLVIVALLSFCTAMYIKRRIRNHNNIVNATAAAAPASTGPHVGALAGTQDPAPVPKAALEQQHVATAPAPAPVPVPVNEPFEW